MYLLLALLFIPTVYSYLNVHSLSLRNSGINSKNVLMATKTSSNKNKNGNANNILGEEWVDRNFQELQSSTKKFSSKRIGEEISLMRDIDVSRSNNYYDTTLAKTRKGRLSALQANDLNEKFIVDTNYYKLMNVGFDRRLALETGSTNTGLGKNNILHKSAETTAATFDVGKSKEDQLRELQAARNLERPGFIKMLPESLHKYYDYLRSLEKVPKKSEKTRALFLGGFFSFVVWLNASVRSSFMYNVIGNLMLLSALLSRGQPQIENKPGMPRRQPASWSAMAFRSALAIQFLYSVPVSLIMMIVTAPFPLPGSFRGKLAMTSGLLSAAFFTSKYEVFEVKGKGGWRWRKAMDDIKESDEKELADQITQSKSEMYDYDYDPMIDDYPRRMKCLDELDGGLEGPGVGGSGQLDEDDAAEHYNQWRDDMKNSRRSPIEYVAPEEPWVGGKKDMYVDKVPKWLGEAYERNVRNANQWRGKPTIYEKDTSEFEDVEGPIGFRDKRPDWLDLFGSGIWQEKTQASRKLAREFGTYRKTMHKLDKDVVLKKCDE